MAPNIPEIEWQNVGEDRNGPKIDEAIGMHVVVGLLEVRMVSQVYGLRWIEEPLIATIVEIYTNSVIDTRSEWNIRTLCWTLMTKLRGHGLLIPYILVLAIPIRREMTGTRL